MKLNISQKNLLFLLLFTVGSMAAGFLNGLTGTGAGIIFLLLFRILRGKLSKNFVITDSEIFGIKNNYIRMTFEPE